MCVCRLHVSQGQAAAQLVHRHAAGPHQGHLHAPLLSVVGSRYYLPSTYVALRVPLSLVSIHTDVETALLGPLAVSMYTWYYTSIVCVLCYQVA